MALQTANMTDALAPSYSTSRRHRGLSAYLGRSSRRSASRTSSKSTSNSEPTYTPPSSTPSSLDEPRSSLPLEHPTDTDYPEFSSHRSKMTVKDKLTRKWGETVSPQPASLFTSDSPSYDTSSPSSTAAPVSSNTSFSASPPDVKRDVQDVGDDASESDSESVIIGSDGYYTVRSTSSEEHAVRKTKQNPRAGKGSIVSTGPVKNARQPVRQSARQSARKSVVQGKAQPKSAKVTKPASKAVSGFKTARVRVTRASSVLTGVPQLSPDKTYLSYYDVKLTYQDVRCLKGDWLTDTDIQFWEEFIDREILPKYPRARICLLRPAITFMLMRTRDPKSIASALPSFKGITHIFLPINDNTDVEQQGGGTHWSLLVVSTLDGVAFHYDSLGDSNYLQARLCVNRLEPLLGISLKLQSILDTPQQENGDDCGVFVCILMRHLLVKRLLHANAREKVSMSMANKVIDAAGGRKEMLKIIESLRKEADRRRSASPYSKSSSSAPPRIE